jgi:nitroreductase
VGPHELDWGTQPDPYRRYVGAPLIELERRESEGPPWFESAFRPAPIPPHPLDRASISQLFFDSLALSAVKRLGQSRWALRVNPSSGNLHPTEATLISGPIPGLRGAMVAHYAPEVHALEVRLDLELERWRELTHGLGTDTVCVGLSTIAWREAWKYGERAFRYCQHDTGHAIAAVAMAAAGLGWHVRLLDEIATEDLARILGTWDTRGPEAEEAQVLLAVGPHVDRCEWFAPERGSLAHWERLPWHGKRNDLSPDHVEWPILEAVTEATRKPHGSPSPEWQPSLPEDAVPANAVLDPHERVSLRQLIHQRRSAVGFDGSTGISRDAFYRYLERTLPESSPLVFAPLWRPRVDLFIFVHRVIGLDSGLYVLIRDVSRKDSLRASFDDAFIWTVPPGCPQHLPLFQLKKGDARSLARSVSCHQEIAADGCFSLGMLAQFQSVLEAEGAWFYRRLFWECGVVGQQLYLEAEAAGIRGTGIGCFFDEPVHQIVGLRDSRVQSLYHFAVGRAVDDPRLTSEPAYSRS